MFRILLMTFVLSVTPLLAQPLRPAPQMQNPPQPPVGMHPPAEVAPDAPVVTIHGLCPEGQSGKPESCAMVLTRQQFETMIASVNISGQTYTKPALRSMAATYVTVLALADAGEKAGVEKDPRFQEFMKVARTRALADAYRRYLEEKYAKPSDEEIEAYYKQNSGKFQQVKIDRIIIPRVNPKRPQEDRNEFAKKARQLALDIRERAANGEDMDDLQKEAYKTLGIDSQPPPTEVVTPNRRGAFLPATEHDLNALKPGQVTKVEYEPSGFNIYKLRGRMALPLEQAKAEIVRDISQKNIDAALKAATGGVHTDFNEQFFNPYPAGPPPAYRAPDHYPMPKNSSVGRPAAPAGAPVEGGNPAPAAQKPASPK